MHPNRAFWSGRQVCVTGGTGFLGFQVVKQLLALGSRVRVLALPPRPDHPLRALPAVTPLYGDLLDFSQVRSALVNCDIVLHAAGPVAASGRMHAVHVLGTRNVLAAAPPNARLVHTSSVVAIAASRCGQVLDETSPFNLDDLAVDYVQAKRAAEQVACLAAARGQHVVVVNPAYLIGPDDYEPSVMGKFCLRAWKGRLPVTPPGGFNLVDVRDVAAGLLLAAEHGRPGRRYILGGENCRLGEFARRLAQTAGMQPRVVPWLPSWIFTGLARLVECRARLTGRTPYLSLQQARLSRFFWYYRSARAERELGYRPRPLAETLADTFAWHRCHHPWLLRGLSRWWMRPQAA